MLVNGVQAVLSSRRFRRRLPLLAGLVLVAGVIAFLVAYFGNTGRSLQRPLSKEPARDVSKVPKTVKLAPGALHVAREFIRTAVARRNLARSYTLVGPALKQSYTLAEWMKGDIPVVPYPAEAIDFAPYKVDYSYPNEALIEVALLPKPGSKIKPQIFYVGLVRVGKGEHRRWVVNSWVPRGSPRIPCGNATCAG